MIGKATNIFREFGFAGGLLYLANRLLQALSPRMGLYAYEFMAQPIPAQPIVPPRLVKSFTYRLIPRGHPDIARMPARADIKESRFAQGAICLGTYRGDELVGYIWLCFDRYLEDEVRCDYHLADPTRSVFDFDLYVMPQYRMGLGFMAVWHGANEYLRERGVTYTFSRLTRLNTASKRSHAHLKWERIGQALILQAWRAELMFFTIAPYVALSLAPARRIALRLGRTASAKESPSMTPEERPS
jgi:hypothetical protein